MALVGSGGTVGANVIDAINVSYQRIFTLEMERRADTPLFSRLAMETRSTNKYEKYAWMLRMVRMTRALGERSYSDAQIFEHLISNETYWATMLTKIEDIEDGTYVLESKTQLEMLAEAYFDRRNLEIYKLLENGFDADGPDGVPFFSTAHPYGVAELIEGNGAEEYVFDQQGSYSNRTTASLSADALWAAKENFALMTDHLGNPANAMPNLLVVGPKQERLAREILTQPSVVEVVGGTPVVKPNDTLGAFELLVEPRLGTSLAWYLFDTTKRLKPFIFQNRISPQFQMVGSNSANAAEGAIDNFVFENDAIKHGVRARFGSGYGVPFLAYGSVGDDS